jgi:hypothetical protein
MITLSLEGRLGFRLGLYEPGHEDEAEFFGPRFEPSQIDTLAMKMVIDEFKSSHDPGRVGIFIVREEPCPAS